MGLDLHFYSSDHKLETKEDGVTIKRSQAKDLTHIDSLRKEWKIHDYIAESYFASDGDDDYGFNGIYYDITHLIPELINTFNDYEYEHVFPLFKELLWATAQGKRIIYSGY